MNMISVIKPGLFTTIQDLGRYGFQKDGVVVSGAMDHYAHRLANYLVGNEDDAPTLEVTLIGPKLHFDVDAVISICGGNLSPSINGKPIPMWKSIFIKKKEVLQFGNIVHGARSYLAVSGGFHVPMVMNSASTYARGKFGGFYGRALQQHDTLTISPLSEFAKRIKEQLVRNGNSNWTVPHSTTYSPSKIRVMKGRQFEKFSSINREHFLNSSYKIEANSDRMGYRFEGQSLFLSKKEEMLSEAVTFGTIQITTEGKPIILLADRQTTGGYPKIAQVASVDFPSLAQMKPGDIIKFELITVDEAQQLFRERERNIQLIKTGINLKYR